MPAWLSDPEVWKLVTIPVVAAVVGWFTNVVAIELTFRPLEFRGLRPLLGWQGIIPSKATKMATIFVDRTMFRLGTLEELFEEMDPDLIAAHVAEVMDARLEAYTHEVMYYENPGLWRLIPEPIKAGIVKRVRAQMPALVDNLMREIASNVDDVLDFKAMLVEQLERDKDLLNRLFLESGSVEFAFIIRSGLYFGFLFGLAQLAVWLAYPALWVLPAFGFLVGWATNWLALNIIFRPLEPVRVGPWTIQGLFLKRQPEVATVWCRLVTTEILTIQHIVYAMLYGPKSDRARELIRTHIRPVVDEVADAYGLVSDLAVDEATMEELRESVGDKAVEVSTDPFDHWPFNRDRAVIIERLLRERMVKMPPDEFQDLLRPCFQEDEWKLILAGGVLGLLAGLAQAVFVFGAG